jgi:hypothetical protein
MHARQIISGNQRTCIVAPKGNPSCPTGNQWQSVAISGNQWQSMARTWPRLSTNSKAISGNQWQSVAISGTHLAQIVDELNVE